MVESITRTLILNKNGQYTITLPKTIMCIMGAKSGDSFKFIYQQKDTLKLVRMGCDAT
jgi:hypothetical protein